MTYRGDFPEEKALFLVGWEGFLQVEKRKGGLRGPSSGFGMSTGSEVRKHPCTWGVVNIPA